MSHLKVTLYLHKLLTQIFSFTLKKKSLQFEVRFLLRKLSMMAFRIH